MLAPLWFVAAFAPQDGFVHWETPHVSPLALTPDGSRLLAVNTPDQRLEVLALGGGRPTLLAAIPVGIDPVSVRARTEDEVWVVNHVSDSISIVSLSAGRVVATLATDDEPADVVFAGTPERAFVTCSQANTVLVFDPAQRAAAPLRLPIRGEDPRALARSPDGTRVYAAIFESGNRTTAIEAPVNDPASPSAGVNPPPNTLAGFDPPVNPALPPPPRVALIVRQGSDELWRDDAGRDWSAYVDGALAGQSERRPGWRLLDHDVAVIDTATLAVEYEDHLMNLVMALAVNPASGEVTAVGSDAHNEIRFEPRLRGVFARMLLARFAPGSPAPAVRVDLNPQLDYSSATVPPAVRALGFSEPRGIAWNAAGTRAWVTGMGSNGVLELDAQGARVQPAPIEVGAGPTGIVVDEARGRLYVLARFDSALSVVELATRRERWRVPFHDPSPPAIARGRAQLYDARATSGTGHVSCATCHTDARMDRLAWDLGDPSGSMQALDPQANLGAGLPLLTTGFEDWHPMKGPLLTQTLQDIVGHEPFHWRGDRAGLEDFAGAFVSLLGDDAPPSSADMQAFEDFLATITFPPNPFRTLTNELPTNLELPGHYTTGRFAPAGQPLPAGNAQRGALLFRPPNRLDLGLSACATCHTAPTGGGSTQRWNGTHFEPLAPGPRGEQHVALVSVDGFENRTLKVPQLRNLYERTGLELTQLESTAGFGYRLDGLRSSIAAFVANFQVASDQEVADLVALMLAFSGDTVAGGPLDRPLLPPGPPSLASHAAVGRQLTLAGAPTPAETTLLGVLLAEAELQRVALVARGTKLGLARGWYYLGAGRWASDRAQEEATSAELLALAAPGAELTLTAVPAGTERRSGVDRDADGWFDRDELAAGSDPADPRSRPRHGYVPGGRRP